MEEAVSIRTAIRSASPRPAGTATEAHRSTPTEGTATEVCRSTPTASSPDSRGGMRRPGVSEREYTFPSGCATISQSCRDFSERGNRDASGRKRGRALPRWRPPAGRAEEGGAPSPEGLRALPCEAGLAQRGALPGRRSEGGRSGYPVVLL